MKYKMYLSTAFLVIILLPLLSAKTNEMARVEAFNINTIEFVEVEDGINLGFDSAKYLPEDFDPYTTEIGIESIDFIEDEEVNLDFDTTAYLPKGFDAYR